MLTPDRQGLLRCDLTACHIEVAAEVKAVCSSIAVMQKGIEIEVLKYISRIDWIGKIEIADLEALHMNVSWVPP